MIEISAVHIVRRIAIKRMQSLVWLELLRSTTQSLYSSFARTSWKPLFNWVQAVQPLFISANFAKSSLRIRRRGLLGIWAFSRYGRAQILPCDENITVEGYIVVGQLTCLNLVSEWVDDLFLLTHSWCSLPYLPQLRQWETPLKNLVRAEHKHFATDGILFSNSETSKVSRSTVLSLITQDREVPTQKYQHTLEQAGCDDGVVEEHPSLFLFWATKVQWGSTPNEQWDRVDQEAVPYLELDQRARKTLTWSADSWTMTLRSSPVHLGFKEISKLLAKQELSLKSRCPRTNLKDTGRLQF